MALSFIEGDVESVQVSGVSSGHVFHLSGRAEWFHIAFSLGESKNSALLSAVLTAMANRLPVSAGFESIDNNTADVLMVILKQRS